MLDKILRYSLFLFTALFFVCVGFAIADTCTRYHDPKDQPILVENGIISTKEHEDSHFHPIMLNGHLSGIISPEEFRLKLQYSKHESTINVTEAEWNSAVVNESVKVYYKIGKSGICYFIRYEKTNQK